MINHPNRNKTEEIAVVVTTEHRGVFFGYIDPKDSKKDIIDLRAARNCIYWSHGVRGFMGLAATGPDKSSKVGPAADIEIRNITSVIKCTPEATTAWEAAPWSK